MGERKSYTAKLAAKNHEYFNNQAKFSIYNMSVKEPAISSKVSDFSYFWNKKKRRQLFRKMEKKSAATKTKDRKYIQLEILILIFACLSLDR